MTEHSVLKLELPDGPTPSEHPNEAYKHVVSEGSQSARMLPSTRHSSAEPSFGARQPFKLDDPRLVVTFSVVLNRSPLSEASDLVL